MELGFACEWGGFFAWGSSYWGHEDVDHVLVGRRREVRMHCGVGALGSRRLMALIGVSVFHVYAEDKIG